MTNKPHPIASFFREEFLKWSARMVFLVLGVALVWLLTPVSEKLQAIWESPETLAELRSVVEERDDATQAALKGIQQSVDMLSREMLIARAPQEIVEYGPASKFSSGCRAGETCLLTLEVRRTSDAAERCEILQNSVRREIIAAQSGRTWEPEVVAGTTRNIGTTFVLIEVKVQLPLGLTRGRYYYRQVTFYQNCPWQHDGKPPVSSVSPLIMLEIE